MSTDNQVNDVLQQAIAEAIAVIEDPGLSPQGRVLAALRRDYRVHPARAADAAAIVREYQREASDALRRCDYAHLTNIVERFYRTMNRSGLQAPPRELTERERVASELVRLGWGGEELDAVFSLFASSTIIAFDWRSITTDDGLLHSRESIRLGLKPRWSKISDEEWIRAMGPIREVRFDAAGQPYFVADALRG